MVDSWPGFSGPDTLTAPAALSTAGGLVEARFNTASDYAATLWSGAQNLLTQLGELNLVIAWDPITMEEVDTGGLDGISAVEPPEPSINPIVVASTVFTGTEPSPVEVNLPTRTAPVSNITDPDFTIPDPPDVTWPVFSAESPSLSDITIPGAPTLTLPVAPQLPEIVIPSPPEYNIPEFEWELPTDDLTPPNPQFSWNEAEYDSAVKTVLAEKLYSDIILGGSGLSDTVEQAIYDRAISRQLTEEQTMLDKTLEFFSSRLYELPPGALSHQMLEMNNKSLAIREDLNRDILIQQGNLAQKNTQFIISASIQNEKNLMDNTNAFQARALDAAKFVVQGALLVYQMKVEAYKAKLVAYTAQAEVYKARIAGEIGKADFYKAQMEGVKASAEVQKAIAQVYAIQVEGAKIYIDLYKAEMEGAAIQAKVDELRIQGFAALVQAYSAQVVASSERYRGYQAQIAGEVAKAELYKSQAQVYGTLVEAYKTEIQADTLVLQQQIEINRNEIEVYKAQIQKYLADVQAAVASAEIQVKAEGLKIDIFKALADNYAKEIESLTRVFLGKVEQAKAMADVEVKEAELIIKEALGKYELAMKSITAAAQIASQMAASAISGVSASANIQHGESRSDSSSMSVSQIVQNQNVISHSAEWKYIYTYEN